MKRLFLGLFFRVLFIIVLLVLPCQGVFSLSNLWPDNDARIDGSVDTMDDVDDFINTLSLDIHERILAADGETVQIQTNWTATGKTCTDLGTVTTADINAGTWQGTIDGNWTAAGQTCADLGTVTTVDINAGTVDAITSLTVANNVDIGAFEMRALTFESDQATGTAPLTVASTTKVTNLDADTVDGYSAADTEMKPFGAWLARAKDTVYLAATDGFVTAWADTGSTCWGYTDNANPPTTVVQKEGDAGAPSSIAFPVKNGDRWKVTANVAATIYWIPYGS